MKKLFIAAIAILYFASLHAQNNKTDFNLDFEHTLNEVNLPVGGNVWGKDYLVATDSTVSYSGKKSVLIQKAKDNASFGCIAMSIPAVYESGSIVLTGWLKYEDIKDGSVGLFMRIDGPGGVLQFENMQGEKIMGNSDWRQYKIELYLPPTAKTIYVGALNSGSGKLWADKLDVTIKGRELSKSKLKKQEDYKAIKDTEFDKTSGINNIDSTSQKAEDLKILGLVWGYLKYYHPAVASGNYNWDYELFRILPKVLAAKTPQQRDYVLYKWISSLGDLVPGNEAASKNVKLKADLDWVVSSGLSPDLTKILSDIKTVKKPNKHYYIDFLSVGNPVFTHEESYADMDYKDAGYRMLSLYRYWNMIQYFFPDRHLIGEDWKNVLLEFIPRFATAANETEYKVAVLELIGRINDTHANVWMADNALARFLGKQLAAPNVVFVGDEPVVKDFYDEQKGTATGLQRGDIITAINGKPLAQIIKERLPYYPASNYATKLRDIGQTLLRTNDSIINIAYTRKGQPFSKVLKTYNISSLDRYGSKKPKDTCFKFISPKIAYLYPGTISNSYVPKILRDIKNTDALIIDMRCYPKDFIVFSVGNFLSDKKKEFVKFTNTSLKNPGEFIIGNNESVGGKQQYKGKIIVLVNETSQSQAEYTSMAFRALGATIIGSTTAGADGNVSEVMLPGGIRSMISGIGVLYPDGTETQRVGIVPDIEVKPTIQGIAEGRDEVLEKAIEFINSNNRN